ncbi:MAG: CPBP family intramembrane metalloprotease [Lachnospiraceae bacterium]|nr:CPBP family intramembrane metalloprotease [Lachnospiraceae bacterium]
MSDYEVINDTAGDEDRVKEDSSPDRDIAEEESPKGEQVTSFRQKTEPLTPEQIIFFSVRDFFHAIGPMVSYIVISLVCLSVGFLLSGMVGAGFDNYLEQRSNLAIAVAVVITLIRLRRKSKKTGSTFFEDASLYHTDINKKKILWAFLFGAGAALFLSSVLTLVPKVGIFATYSTHVGKMYQRSDIALTIVESAVLTPLVEEIIFRGYMLNRLLVRWPEIPALIVTTLIFSVMHGSSIWFVYSFAMGLIIGILSLKEGNILYGIFLHAGFNLPSVVQWFIFFMYPEKQNAGVATDIFRVILLGMLGAATAGLIYMLYRKEGESERQAGI